ncbi:hypothetical protein [Flavobacterium geliluteum]|uniref:Uncharacterized protein n=1 Tax=Flavobacterium geliluteum TaxID=2816120 RepID=A0A941AZA4_9FLAO|nr:hypothetical protein [Flavobacterium geliluteum]MBP4138732.1 hypothetical protein [Flavobacterium geliluteum]
MIKINLKIQFLLFVLCLFFIGLGINNILTEGFKSGVHLFYQVSPVMPFVFSAILFGANIYSKKTTQK